MKRLAAAILLLSFSALLAEGILLPLSGCAKERVSTCSVAGRCKMMKEMMGKHHNKKEDRRDRSCSDCPLFTVTIAKEPFRLESPGSFVKMEYSVMLNNNLSEYQSPKWKPPDTSRV